MSRRASPHATCRLPPKKQEFRPTRLRISIDRNPAGRCAQQPCRGHETTVCFWVCFARVFLFSPHGREFCPAALDQSRSAVAQFARSRRVFLPQKARSRDSGRADRAFRVRSSRALPANASVVRLVRFFTPLFRVASASARSVRARLAARARARRAHGGVDARTRSLRSLGHARVASAHGALNMAALVEGKVAPPGNSSPPSNDESEDDDDVRDPPSRLARVSARSDGRTRGFLPRRSRARPESVPPARFGPRGGSNRPRRGRDRALSEPANVTSTSRETCDARGMRSLLFLTARPRSPPTPPARDPPRSPRE